MAILPKISALVLSRSSISQSTGAVSLILALDHLVVITYERADLDLVPMEASLTAIICPVSIAEPSILRFFTSRMYPKFRWSMGSSVRICVIISGRSGSLTSGAS